MASSPTSQPPPPPPQITHHNPSLLLSPSQTPNSTPSSAQTPTPYALLLLNQPLNTHALALLSPAASLLLCADGGANHLYNHHITSRTPYTHRIPDAIIGDLDSLSAEAGDYFSKKGTKIVMDGDQYSTDFTKCLRWIRGKWDDVHGKGEEEEEGRLDVIVLGGLGGRVDQGFSLVHHIYLAGKDKSLLNGRIFLLSEQSLSFVLEMGVNEIEVGELQGQGKVFNENVGVIPVMGRARISMRGFEWDVEDWETEFGGQISTSNHLRSEKVVVDVKEGGQCLFTLELAGHLCLGT